jgi:hypothetical protein
MSEARCNNVRATAAPALPRLMRITHRPYSREHGRKFRMGLLERRRWAGGFASASHFARAGNPEDAKPLKLDTELLIDEY